MGDQDKPWLGSGPGQRVGCGAILVQNGRSYRQDDEALCYLSWNSIHSFQKDFDAAVDQYGQLLKYSDVVSSVVAERTIDEIAAFALDPKATLMLCQATYNVKKVCKDRLTKLA